MENGYTKEEWKMVEETRKIMHAPEIAVSATCVRVPVMVGHSEAVQIEFAHPMSPEEAKQILSRAPGVRLMDEPAGRRYPYPLMVAGQDDVYVGRIRKDISHPNGLVLWIVGDNLRKGAALNAVQIAERLVPGD
jgi:aspartate-semialdehyde dehydrogenase